MPRGAPDYSDERAYGPLHRLDDQGELAARLGSIVTYERGGRVIRLETFENGRSLWSTEEYGSGADIALSSERAMSGGYSLKFVTGGDGAVAAKSTYQVPYHVLSRYGVGYCFTHDPNLRYHYSFIYLRDGSNVEEYCVAYDIQNDRILIRVPGPAWQTVKSDIDLKTDGWLFHSHKLIVDVEEKAYYRLVIDNEVVDLSDYGPYITESDDPPYLEIAIQFTGWAGSNYSTWVDNVVITQDEQ